ncbi:MAG: Gfo/Idh/MocA family oxidoreductase [Clostridia bacterium]|nr:Gfo/Idh/MocA family oxidoreductase [Clostridia bacterium]
MHISVFTDELAREVTELLPTFAAWGLKYVDFRSRVYGRAIEDLSVEQLRSLRAQLDTLGLRTGVIQSSLCKIHLPDREGMAREEKKLEGILRAADILDCRLVRSFNYWQHDQNDPRCGELAMRPDALAQVLDMFDPIARRAQAEGLILGFENCGQTPDEVITLLEALNVPEWGMAWDVSNMFELLPQAQGDCITYFTKALKYANMLHVKCRGVLPEIEGKKVPWDRVLRGALTTGRDLPVSIETHLPAGNHGLTHEEATRRCCAHIEKVMPQSAPSDMATALTVKEYFPRPYHDDPVRMAVVGLGMGKNRCAQLTETDGIKLVAVCDTNAEKAKKVGEQFGVRYTDTLGDILDDPSIEAVYVVTPTGTHCAIAEQCLLAGKHALLTKPMDVDYRRCLALKALAEQRGLMMACDFDLHFRGALKELRLAVEAGYFGKLKSVHTTLNIKRTEDYFRENGGWRGTYALDGGGALSNQGIHEIDRILSIFGMPRRVRCHTTRQTFDIEAEDYGVGEMELADGVIARISSTTSYPASPWYTRVEVYGDRGAYLLTSGGPEGEHVYWWHDGKWTETAPYPVKKEWNQAADNFANALRTGEPLIVTADNGIRSRYVLDMMYQSAREGGVWVETVP